MANTKKQGIARILIIRGKKKYSAICLDFDIIEEADSYKEVDKQILEAVTGYVENICKNNLDNALLNRHAPEKYWTIFRKFNKNLSKKSDLAVKQDVMIQTLPINEFFPKNIKRKALTC